MINLIMGLNISPIPALPLLVSVFIVGLNAKGV